jgi:hypothetical protein
VIADWPGKAPRALIMHADPLSAYAYRWFDGVATRPTIDKAFERYWRHLRRLDERYDMIVSASASLSDRLTAGGLSRVVTNPMGVDPGIFSPDFRDLALRKGMLELCELPEDATLLLGVGRFAPEKRWPMLVDAVTAAGSRRPVGLVLAGQGRERKTIERRIGGNPHIRVLAPITKRHELARVMASADALLHGCEAETFCMVAAEARASGLPLIAPDQGGASDQARASGGWIYESANAAAATEAVAQYCLARESGLDGPRADLPRRARWTTISASCLPAMKRCWRERGRRLDGQIALDSVPPNLLRRGGALPLCSSFARNGSGVEILHVRKRAAGCPAALVRIQTLARSEVDRGIDAIGARGVEVAVVTQHVVDAAGGRGREPGDRVRRIAAIDVGGVEVAAPQPDGHLLASTRNRDVGQGEATVEHQAGVILGGILVKRLGGLRIVAIQVQAQRGAVGADRVLVIDRADAALRGVNTM